MKRILVFSLAYHPLIGGAELAVSEITKRISPADFAFTLVTLRFKLEHPRRERIGNVEVYRVGFGGYLGKVFFPFLAALKGRSLHRQKPFDGGWAIMTYMVLPIILMRFLGVRIPYAINLQDGDSARHVFGRLHILPFLLLIRLGFRRASAVQAISTYLSLWASRMGFQKKVAIVPNGVTVRQFAKANAGEKRKGNTHHCFPISS